MLIGWQHIIDHLEKYVVQLTPTRHVGNQMRFSLSKLFLVVTIAAVACVVIYRSHYWTDAIVIPTALLFATMMAASAFGMRGRARAMALAFTLVGGGYLVVALTSVWYVLHHARRPIR